jgi:hypothetical protein
VYWLAWPVSGLRTHKATKAPRAGCHFGAVVFLGKWLTSKQLSGAKNKSQAAASPRRAGVELQVRGSPQRTPGVTPAQPELTRQNGRGNVASTSPEFCSLPSARSRTCSLKRQHLFCISISNLVPSLRSQPGVRSPSLFFKFLQVPFPETFCSLYPLGNRIFLLFAITTGA